MELKILYGVFEIIHLSKDEKIFRHIGNTQAMNREEAIRNVMFRRYGQRWNETYSNYQPIAAAFGSYGYRRMNIIARAQVAKERREAVQETMFVIGGTR